MRLLKCTLAVVLLFVCVPSFAQDEDSIISRYGQGLIAAGVPVTSQDTRVSYAGGYPVGDWSGHAQYEHFTWCAAFMAADANDKMQNQKPGGNPEAVKRLAIQAATVMGKDRSMDADTALGKLLPSITYVRGKLDHDFFKTSFADTYRGNCTKLSNWTAPPPSGLEGSVPQQGFVADKIPMTAADAMVPATATGRLAEWKGHALYEVYGWCSAFMSVESVTVGPTGIAGSREMNAHAVRALAKDRHMTEADATALMTGVGAPLEAKLKEAGVLGDVKSVLDYASCAGLNDTTTEEENGGAKPVAAPAVAASVAAVVVKAENTLPGIDFLKDHAPVTLKDTLVPAGATGELALWKGHALYEPYAWCSTFMAVSTAAYGTGLDDKMREHAVQRMVKDRGISASDAGYLIGVPVRNYKSEMRSSGVAKGATGERHYAGCVELEARAAAEEAKP